MYVSVQFWIKKWTQRRPACGIQADFYTKQNVLTLLMPTFALSAFPKTVNSRVNGSGVAFESNYTC